MSETALSISFKDQLCFEAHCDYILNANHVPPRIPYLPRRDPDARAKVNLDLALLRTRLNSSCHRYNNAKGWRWVDFRPKHHTQAPRSPTVVFGGKALEQPYGQYRVGSGGQNQSRGTHRLLMTPSGKFDDGRYAEALNFVFSHDYGGQSGRGREGGARGKKRPLFRSGFRCSKPHDDRVERARERREFVVYPFNNPQPFDHRGLDVETIRDTQLRTCVSPKPLNYDLMRKRNWKTAYTGNQTAYGDINRSIDFKFNTVKTPEPRYDLSLTMDKGRYSPAFSAYKAYLDRINNTISSD